MEKRNYFLLYQSPAGTERVYHLAGSLTVGRAPTCQVVLDDEGVSREHCELRLTRSGVTLKDLGSTNGTFLNGSKVTEAVVQPGGRIVVGQACLVLYQADPTSADGGERTGVLGATTVEVILKAASERAPDAAVFRESGIRGDALNALFRVTDLVNAGDDPSKILDEFLQILMQLFGMDLGAVYQRDESSGALTRVCIVNRTGDQGYEPSQSVLQRVASENVSVVAVDPLKDPRFRKARSIAASGAARILCVPMRTAGEVFGAVYLSSLKDPAAASVLGESALQILAALTSQVSQALENLNYRRRLERDNRILRSELPAPSDLVGGSKTLNQVRVLARKVAATDTTVLIRGESGTGKELIAASIHMDSRRAGRPMVSVNCGAIPESMVESELFGHEKGAFTGALERRLGKFELAHEGTLFLDEIGELPLAAQVKLLRVLEEKCFYRVGGEELVRVDVRIIAATNTDLDEKTSQGTFREDLLYRLKVFQIEAPPLREHREDIPELAARLLERLGAADAAITPEGLKRLKAREWPGNVRELRNVLERELILCEDGPLAFENMGIKESAGSMAVGSEATLKEMERAHILGLLRAMNWNKKLVAQILGISRPTLYDKIKNHGIEEDKPGA